MKQENTLQCFLFFLPGARCQREAGVGRKVSNRGEHEDRWPGDGGGGPQDPCPHVDAVPAQKALASTAPDRSQGRQARPGQEQRGELFAVVLLRRIKLPAKLPALWRREAVSYTHLTLPTTPYV